jgi:prolyl-tRNA synthetase
MASDSVFMARRDKQPNEKTAMKREDFLARVPDLLDDIQKNLFEKARKHLSDHTVKIDDPKAFYDFFTPKDSEKPEIHGGFAQCHWCGSASCESKIKDDLSVTIRCIPFDNPQENGTCIGCGKESRERVIFAKAY